MNIMERLSCEMGVAETKIASIAQRSNREKFSELLLSLNQSFGVKDRDRIRLDIKLTREEMAAMIGIAPENLMRLVSEFKNSFILGQEKKTLYILDAEKLAIYANMPI
jgi:CRP-like cAMP-binding protein